MYYYLYTPIEYRSFDILGKCVTMPHTFTSQEHQRSWAELAITLAGLAASGLNWQCLWLAWLAWAELVVPVAGLAAPGLPLCNFAMSFLAVNTHYILRYPRLLSFMLENCQ